MRTHQALSMRTGKGKATSDIADGSKKGVERNGVERVEAECGRERGESVAGLWSGSVGWELGDQPVL